MPSKTSLTRPARRRDSSCRCFPSFRSSRRSRGMMTNCAPMTTTVMAPSHMFCTTMNRRAVSAWKPRNTGVMKASPMNPPIGSTSSLMIVAVSDDLTVRRASGVNRSMRREQVEPHPPQHALAQHPLGDVDPVLEGAVHDHEEQEHAREAEQEADPAHLEALEDLDRSAAEPAWPAQNGFQEGRSGPAVDEGFALNRLIHDLARQIERSEVERQRSQDDRTNNELVAARMLPNVAKKALIHLLQRYHRHGHPRTLFSRNKRRLYAGGLGSCTKTQQTCCHPSAAPLRDGKPAWQTG